MTEIERLAVLRSFAVLDTPPDPALDRIVALARLVMDAPMSTVSLVDDQRQWFKARSGVETCETPRDQAFCAHALPLARGELLVVNDARADPRFADNPLVTGEPHIRFYAGAVLTSPEGASLGTLCVLDTRPRPPPTPVQAQTLAALAELVAAQLEVQRARRRDAAKRELLALAEGMSGVGHWRLEVATGHVEWSDEVYRIHGVDRASFDPRLDDALAFYDDAGRAEVAERLETAVRDRTGYAFQLRLRRRDGEWREVTCKATCELDAQGAVVAVFGVFQDVTEQATLLRQVREDRERYRLLTQDATDIISTSALDSTVLFVTPAVRRLLGYEPEEVVGRRTLDLTHPDDQAAVTARFTALVRAGPSAPVEPYRFRGRHKDGRWVWLEGQPRVEFDANGRPQVFQDVVRDISERRRVEMELEAARVQAEAAAQAKADFLANMSHELRTPLTSIVGYTGLAAEQPELSELTRDYVRRVQTASRGLLGTVNDILDFSKLEAGEVSIHPVPTDVLAVCRDALELFTPQAAAKDLRLTLEAGRRPPPQLLVDPARLLQLLLNLIGNAVKFTEAGSVGVEVAFRRGELTVAVRDTGRGIPAEALGLLFRRFSQVDGSSTRTHGGTGLGLAICKGLAERMGGTIAVESEPGVGSRFSIRLPAAVASASAAGPQPVGGRFESLEALRVLVVDDNAANRELARIILAGAGAEVSEAVDGADALARLAAEPLDAVLLDMRMPDLDGAAVLARLRSEPGVNAATPVVAYTADALETAQSRCATHGFDGFVAKPVNPTALLTAIKQAVDGEVEAEVRRAG